MRRAPDHPSFGAMEHHSLRRVARGGVLVLGGGFAGRRAAHELGGRGITVVEPRPTPATLGPKAELVVGAAVALDAERRVVHVEAERGRIAIAYAQLIVALGAFADSVRRLGLPSDLRGRVRVDENLRVIGAGNIWAIGDCTSLPPGAAQRGASELRIP
jgi:NADH dehydrogenase FAD-containing subunit